MKKMIIVLSLLLVLLVGCKNKEVSELEQRSSSNDSVAEVETEVVGESVEPEVVESLKVEPEVAVELEVLETVAVEENDTDLVLGTTADEDESLKALKQVYKLIEAHDKLMRADYEFNYIIQADIENITSFGGEYGAKAKNGKSIKGNLECYAVGINYYHDFLYNDDNSKIINTNLLERVELAESPDSILKENLNGEEKVSANAHLLEAIRLVSYLSTANTITPLSFEKDESGYIGQIQSGYAMVLQVNEKDDFYAIFDKNMKLLNIFAVDSNWNGYLKSN